MFKINIEVSARHIHLSKKDLEALFGRGYKLVKKSNLSQPGEFAAEETVDIQKGERKISKVRIIGPLREKTQAELSLTDSFQLGVKLPIRKSGDVKNTPAVSLIGPKGKIRINDGAICVYRHIHMPPVYAKKMKLKDGDMVSVKTEGKRSVIFNNVQVRVSKDFKLAMHIDTDEANAAGINKKGKGIIL